MNFWSIIVNVAAVATIVALVVAILTLRNQNPRREVLVLHDSTSLIAHTEHASDVTVTVKGSEMKQPYVVDVSVSASGRADVGPSAFIGPLILDLGVPIVKELTDVFELHGLRVHSETELALDPTLLKAKAKGPSYSGQFLCEGRPEFSIEPCLENVDIRLASQSKKQTSNLSLLGRELLGPVGGAAGVAAAAALVAQIAAANF